MTQASTDPLPVGRYWIEVDREHSILFAYWHTEATRQGLIEMERKDHDRDSGWSLYVFRVKSPVRWYAEHWGWPNLADAATVDRWKPAPLVVAVRAQRWKLMETFVVGVGTLVLGTILINRFGSRKGDPT